MAVSRMKAVTVVGHAELRGRALEVLHAFGSIQLHAADAGTGAPGTPEEQEAGTGRQQAPGPGADLTDVERRLSELSSCLAYIDRYDPVQKGLVESFLAAREEIDAETWDQAKMYDIAGVVSACHRAEARLAEIRSREAELGVRRRELQPLADIALNLDDLDGTATTSVFFGQGSPPSVERLAGELASSGGVFHLEHLGSIGRQRYFLVIYPKDDQLSAGAVRSGGIEPVSVPAAAGTALEGLAAVEAELAGLEAERQQLASQGTELAQKRIWLQACYDHLLLEKQRLEAAEMLGATERTFVVRGWCPESRIPGLEARLRELGDAVAIEARDPRPDEKPPVVLNNRPLAAPFEIVTNIFGWPSYHEVDPTPVLAPFFAVFFALALTDAGYGLVMLAYCLWMISRPATPKHSYKFFRLMAYASTVTIVVGALTGGWFGNALDFLPGYVGFIRRAKDSIVLFDPVKQPITLMVLSLGLGIVHLMVGVGVKMYRNIRDGNVADALMDQGLWLLLIPSLVVFAAAGAMGLPPALGRAAQYVAMAAALGLVLTQGRANRNIVARLGGGLYSLYGLIGYLSDTLSYTRLLALGLATASLGMAINQIALMVRPVPFVGILLMLVIMAFGHGLSLLINVFGAFIHSGRLQFVEFFSKFFEGGGKAFKPFAERPRFTQLAGR